LPANGALLLNCRLGVNCERGVVAIRSGELTRTHRERLLKGGFLARS
jgi:hypothetical protein